MTSVGKHAPTSIARFATRPLSSPAVTCRTRYVRHGVSRERVVSAPLFPTIETPDRPRETPREPTVLFAGRMTELKGPRVLIDAVATAGRHLGRPIKLVMAGEGPDRAGLIDAARAQAVRASFPGWVTGEERTALLRGASLVAIPSQWPEPFGLVGLEAATHGVPAVAFDVGGISEWLQDGVNGRLVRERGSADAMGRALASVLGDPTVMRTLEQGALRDRRASESRCPPANRGDAFAGGRTMKTMHLLDGRVRPGGRRRRRLQSGPRGGVVAARTPRACLGRCTIRRSSSHCRTR